MEEVSMVREILLDEEIDEQEFVGIINDIDEVTSIKHLYYINLQALKNSL
ncbi:hypothetical protein [Metabacillus litoralis]|nr:hypothetical protein [Metabacillus litoralis]